MPCLSGLTTSMLQTDVLSIAADAVPCKHCRKFIIQLYYKYITTTLWVYEAVVLSVLIYAADSSCNRHESEAFRMKCQCQILGIHWSNFISNVDMQAHTGLMPWGEILVAHRISVFGNIALLESDVPAHMALRIHINLSVGRPPGSNWKRCPGRPMDRPDSSS